MARWASVVPTEGELEILRVLFKRPASVRQVHNELAVQRHKQGRETGYSTTLKMMQLMFEKGLLKRDESRRPQIYQPVDSEEQTQLRLLDHLIQKGFGGSAMRLVLRAVAAKRISKSELAEIRKLLEK
jgi:BlaI family penicillinase repressor